MLIVAVFAFLLKNSNKEKEQWYRYLIVFLFFLVVAKLMGESPVDGGISDTISLVGTFLMFAITPLLGFFIIKYVYDCMDYVKKKEKWMSIIYLGITIILPFRRNKI